MSQAMPRNAGFTLAELLVAVALIGILTAVANTQYLAFISKSRTVEAKLALGNGYTALKSFYADKNSYTACLRQAGFAGEATARRYYSIGFSAPIGSSCGDGTQNCLLFDFAPGGSLCNITDTWVGATTTAGSVIIGGAPDFGAAPSANQFVLGACGRVARRDIADEWQIDHTKRILHRTVGLD